MADIQTGRFGRLFQTLFNLKQRMTLGQAMPDVLGVVDLQAPRPEMEVFLGDDLAAGVATVTGDGTGPSGPSTYLCNPTGSNAVLVTERILGRSSLACTLTVGFFDQATFGGLPGAAGVQVTRDTRRHAAPTAIGSATAGQVRGRANEDTTGIYQQTIRYELAAGGTFELPAAFVLSPGKGLSILCSTTLSVLTTSFLWRERALDRSELIL